MRRAVVNHLLPEMAILGLIEFTLSFAAIYTVIQVTGGSVTLPTVVEVLPRGEIALAAVLTFIAGGIALTIGLYRPEACHNHRRTLVAAGLSAIITFTVLLFVNGRMHNNLSSGHIRYMAELLAAWLAAMTLIRLVYSFAVNRIFLARRILLLGDPGQVGTFSVRLRSSRAGRFDPVVLHDQTLSWPWLRQQGIWGIVLASETETHATDCLLDCKLRGVHVLSGAAFHESYLGRIDLDTVTANNLLLSHGFAATKASAALKRLSDIVLGTCMLVLLLPLMVMTAVAIKIDSPGPALYRQRRVGRFDKTFTLLKFRSMSADAEASGSPRWAQKQDPRVTRIGRIIRAARIDELPQLVNVIRGEMSLVGPRPERPHFVEQLAGAIPFYRQRAYVKPGLTGWAQVNFPYGASVEDAREKLAYDLYYVKNRTIMLDVFILISTVRVVLLREGAR
jgi:exopolysaccharide biosynthesis polyprenyl glycosylphosphotransferase